MPSEFHGSPDEQEVAILEEMVRQNLIQVEETELIGFETVCGLYPLLQPEPYEGADSNNQLLKESLI